MPGSRQATVEVADWCPSIIGTKRLGHRPDDRASQKAGLEVPSQLFEELGFALGSHQALRREATIKQD